MQVKRAAWMVAIIGLCAIQAYAGVWDDVYASWSGLHGYVRPAWHATDGSAVRLRPPGHDQIMHFVETRKTAEIRRCGINFVHQSTTDMGHTITNGYNPRLTGMHERIYFSDCLVTAPAHQSFTEQWPDRTKDLYMALVPTLFHSIGSSNSETMAITKLMIVGGYLPPESKLRLKRNGLYPSMLLYIWKASLPYDVPYAHELRHRRGSLAPSSCSTEIPKNSPARPRPSRSPARTPPTSALCTVRAPASRLVATLALPSGSSHAKAALGLPGSRSVSGDTPQPFEENEMTRFVWAVTLAQGLTNGRHTLRLAPNKNGPVAIKGFRVYRPPLR